MDAAVAAQIEEERASTSPPLTASSFQVDALTGLSLIAATMTAGSGAPSISPPTRARHSAPRLAKMRPTPLDHSSQDDEDADDMEEVPTRASPGRRGGGRRGPASRRGTGGMLGKRAAGSDEGGTAPPTPAAASNKRTKRPEDRKLKKNTREKQRRLEVNQRFWRLSAVLDLASSHKSDKVSILDSAIETIETQRTKLAGLQGQYDGLHAAMMVSSALVSQHPRRPSNSSDAAMGLVMAATATVPVSTAPLPVEFLTKPPPSPPRNGEASPSAAPLVVHTQCTSAAPPQASPPSPPNAAVSLSPQKVKEASAKFEPPARASPEATKSIDSGSTSSSQAAARALSMIGEMA